MLSGVRSFDKLVDYIESSLYTGLESLITLRILHGLTSNLDESRF